MSSVDVIVPCYRYGHFLRACVESVLNQQTSDLRILIIDDASPDNTAEVAAELTKEDRRVEFLRHSKNIGHIATYNEGIRWAKADYMLLLSADDLLAPGALQRAAEVLDAYPEVALTYGRCAEWHDCGPVPSFNAEPDSGCKLHTGLDFIRAVCTTFVNPVPTPCAVVRTSVQNIVGGYRPNLPHSGDLEMWLRFAANGAVASIGSVQAMRRVHGSNMSSEFCSNACIYYKQWKDTYDSFFSEYAGYIDICRLQAEADRVLAERAFWTMWHSSAEGGATAADGSFGSQSSFAPTSASFPRSVGWSGPLARAAVLPRP